MFSAGVSEGGVGFCELSAKSELENYGLMPRGNGGDLCMSGV